MEILPVALIAATLMCSLVAGFLFAFAVVIMPGIGRLDDAAFIRSFQAMDGVIQNNQPLFMLVWAGSVLLLIASVALGIAQLDGSGLALLVVATLLYLVGVQLPTGAGNVPLNNALQTLEVDAMDDAARRTARADFEPRWNRWNAVRTAASVVVSALLLIVLYGL